MSLEAYVKSYIVICLLILQPTLVSGDIPCDNLSASTVLSSTGLLILLVLIKTFFYSLDGVSWMQNMLADISCYLLYTWLACSLAKPDPDFKNFIGIM